MANSNQQGDDSEPLFGSAQEPVFAQSSAGAAQPSGDAPGCDPQLAWQGGIGSCGRPCATCASQSGGNLC